MGGGGDFLASAYRLASNAVGAASLFCNGVCILRSDNALATTLKGKGPLRRMMRRVAKMFCSIWAAIIIMIDDQCGLSLFALLVHQLRYQLHSM